MSTWTSLCVAWVITGALTFARCLVRYGLPKSHDDRVGMWTMLTVSLVAWPLVLIIEAE